MVVVLILIAVWAAAALIAVALCVEAGRADAWSGSQSSLTPAPGSGRFTTVA